MKLCINTQDILSNNIKKSLSLYYKDNMYRYNLVIMTLKNYCHALKIYSGVFILNDNGQNIHIKYESPTDKEYIKLLN